MKRSSIFEQKAMKENVSFLAFVKTLILWSKNHSFLSKISKTIFSDLIIPKNPNEKKFNFWTKTMDYPLRKMSIFLAPFKTLIFWSKIILFYQEYRKKRFFSDLITPNKLT